MPATRQMSPRAASFWETSGLKSKKSSTDGIRAIETLNDRLQTISRFSGVMEVSISSNTTENMMSGSW